jgi:hypothetical protein
VPYILENAGIAGLGVELRAMIISTAVSENFRITRDKYLCISFLLLFVLGTLTKGAPIIDVVDQLMGWSIEV